MSEEVDEIKDLSPEEKKKLKALMEKDAKSFRTPTGFWHWVTALLGAFMVLFYFYAAGVTTVGTQYHLGIYVFITYVLVFLLYPAGGPVMRGILSLLLGAIISSVTAILFFFPDAAAFHARMTEVFDALGDEGLGQALTVGASLWPLALGTLVIAVAVFFCDRVIIARWKQVPCLSDVLFAVAAGGAVYYWISQFEVLNYRAGAENELDALISIAGILLSMEVCRRVLGWSMTLIGAGMIAFAYFGPHLPNHSGAPRLRHRTFGQRPLSYHQRRVRGHGQRPGHLRHPLHLFRRFSAQVRGRAVLHRPPPGPGRQQRRRPGQGRRHRLGPVRLGLGERHRQHRLHRGLHHPADEEGRLPAPRRRRHRTRRLHRRHVPAADHGRRRLPHGRTHRHALLLHHDDLHRAGPALLLLGLLHDPLRSQQAGLKGVQEDSFRPGKQV
jgi:hypothetical protein